MVRSRLGRMGITASCTAAGLFLFFILFWLTLPRASKLVSDNPTTTAFIERYEQRSETDSALPDLRWQWVDYNQISVHMKRAAVVAEDAEFFSHSGFSHYEIGEAVREAIREREAPRGASTITQQTAKNLWLSPSRNPLRKFKEMLLTRRLEKSLTKHRILEIYLNVAEFGVGVYGVGAAAEYYFDKHASELTEHESAMLAASLPRPSSWNPQSDSPYYLGYVDAIEYRLDEAEFLWRHLEPTGS
jgi:monofunctional biosynthetic peptidoglycan transglycosylase